eukprot:SAG31_NODE_1403_length_8489_cov_15.730751_1_plen_78_part_00
MGYLPIYHLAHRIRAMYRPLSFRMFAADSTGSNDPTLMNLIKDHRMDHGMAHITDGRFHFVATKISVCARMCRSRAS